MRYIVGLALLTLTLSGCGYTICRAFGNTTKQCAYNCRWDYVLDEKGERVKEPWFPYADKLEESCDYAPGKVLFP